LPIQALLAPENLRTFLIELGLDDPPDLSSDSGFAQKLSDATLQILSLIPDLTELADAAEAGDNAKIIEAAARLIEKIVKLGLDLDAVAEDLKRATSGSADAAAIAEFAEEFVERLFEAAIVRYLETDHPIIRQILVLLTLVEITPVTIGITLEGIELQVYRRRLYLDRLGKLFQDLAGFFKTAYGWGDESFDGRRLFQNTSDLFVALGPLAGLIDSNENATPALGFFNIVLAPTQGVHPPGLEGRLDADLTESVALTLAQINDDWRVDLQLTGKFGAGLTVRLLPVAKLEVQTPSGTLEGDSSLTLVGAAADPSKPFVIFGETMGSRLEAKRVQAGLIAALKWDIAQNKANADVRFETKFVGAKAIIDTSHSDGFLAKILPSDGLSLDFDFDLGWSAARGFFFSGSAGLETAIALNQTLGPFRLDTVHLILGVAADKLRLEASLDGSGVLGPITASVERIGVALDLKFVRGNLGPVDLGVGFKFPTGLGISIDAGPISGGGFIEYDEPNGRYAGILALSLYSIEVKAIGLLDTKLPGGEPGFSFLVIISVEFTPIQLGFGFTLIGVGGLCGINRNFVTEALQSGLRQHSLDHILFPKDPIKNAPAIISDLRTILPATEGRHVFGPMLEIGWGGGLNLLTAELGIILAVPSPVVIAILGQVNVNLPNPAAAVIELHLDVLGVIDFGKKLFSLDASLHDSRIVVFTVFGNMAMRLTWGDRPSFALSIGGLNPHFQPPAGFPTLRRLTIALSATDDFHLSIQTYFAITSNSFQFGARAELYAGVSEFNVYGWLGFDALFSFEPFSFIVDFSAGLALRSGSEVLFAISLTGQLSGPTPWHVKGEAHISLLFFDIGVDVDVTWGESRTIEPPATDAWPPLRDAIANPANWSGALPPGIPAVVTLANPRSDGGVAVLVDPSGALTMRERVLPLNQTLTKFGEATPGPQTIFTLESESVSLGGQHPTPFRVVRDKFAPAQFEAMSDHDKLSRPSFEDRDAGFSIGEGQLAFGRPFGRDVSFKDVYLDDKAPPPSTVIFQPGLTLQLQWARSNAAFKSTLRLTGNGKYAAPRAAPQLVTLDDERFVIATTTDLTQRADIAAPATKGEMFQALATHLARNPGDRDLLQVVPIHEMAA
jgi:hypothetical protein